MPYNKRKNIMLCQPLDDINLDKNFKHVTTMIGQPKLDGQRCWVDWNTFGEGEPALISSEGNLIRGVPHINLAVRELKNCFLGGGEVEWDGELYVHRLPFEEIVSRTKRLEDNLHKDYISIEYHIFDFKSTEPIIQRDRLKLCQTAIDRFKKEADPLLKSCINFVESVPLRRQDIDDYLDKCVSSGYEGIILRNPLAMYVEKRPYTILKWKPAKTDFYRIVGVEEAKSEKNRCPLGRLGSVECEDRYGNRFHVSPGLGLDNVKKKELWKNKEELIGRFAKVFYQNLTNGSVPRFGRFSKIVAVVDENEEKW